MKDLLKRLDQHPIAKGVSKVVIIHGDVLKGNDSGRELRLRVLRVPLQVLA
jgi:hypothetical protein